MAISQPLDHDEVTTYVDAPPDAVYALVSDVTRTPEYSPEIVSCTWLDDAEGPAVGARFEAVNSAGRGPNWKNRPVVTAAAPGREFAFARTERMAGTVEWRFRLTPEGAGTRVTESYAVTAPLTPVGWFVIGKIYGLKDRRGDLRNGMTRSLERIREILEVPSGA